MTITNLADFGYRELAIAGQLLTAYANGDNNYAFFSNGSVQVMMNQNSGNVFLTDEDFNVLMLNGDNLEEFFNSPYEGREGFFDDLLSEYDDMHEEDKEWFMNIAQALGREDELPISEENEN